MDNRSSFFQWDLNQRLELSDVDVGTELHFCNPMSKETECLTVFAYEDNGVVYADVPNVILQIAGAFKVYVWPFYTSKYRKYTVISRPKPADYVYEEVEIYTIEQVVNEALETAKESGEFDIEDGSVTTDKLSEDVKDELGKIQVAQKTADDAFIVSDKALSSAEAAIIKAEMAESIAKGANEAIPFDSEHQMLSWIKEQKAKDIDTVTGVSIPTDGKYYMVVAVDRTLVECEDEYGDKHFIFPDSCDITVEYDDGTVENYLYNHYNINGFKCVFVNNGRLYATVPLLNGKSVEIVYSNFYDGNYAVIGNSGGSTNKNPTYRLISPTMGVDVTEHDLAFTETPIVVTISSDDKTLRSLTYMYDIKAVTDFYIRDENVPDYWWDGANIYKLETDKANLTPIEDGLRNILNAINSIL